MKYSDTYYAREIINLKTITLYFVTLSHFELDIVGIIIYVYIVYIIKYLFVYH